MRPGRSVVMVTGWGCSVTTPTSGGGLTGAAVLPDEHAANPAPQTRQRLVALRRAKKLRLRIVHPFSRFTAGSVAARRTRALDHFYQVSNISQLSLQPFKCACILTLHACQYSYMMSSQMWTIWTFVDMRVKLRKWMERIRHDRHTFSRQL